MTVKEMEQLFYSLKGMTFLIPCIPTISERDQAMLDSMIPEKLANGEIAADSEEAQAILDSFIGQEFVMQDQVRLKPDTLTNGSEYFLPIFTSREEMGDYGTHFSTIEIDIAQALDLAEIVEEGETKPLDGIVLNAFTEPFVIVPDMYGLLR